ncbi:hypothetical protein [Comamonas piscis]
MKYSRWQKTWFLLFWLYSIVQVLSLLSRVISGYDFDILQVIVLSNDVCCLIGVYRYSRNIKIKHHLLGFFYYLNSAIMSVRGLMAAMFIFSDFDNSNFLPLLLPIVGLTLVFFVAALLLTYAVSDKYKYVNPI